MVQICQAPGDADDFDVLIEDSFCGLLILGEHFLIELRVVRDWEKVTLAELKDALAHSSEFPRPVDMPTSSEMAELKIFEHLYSDEQDSGTPRRQLAPARAYDRCRRRVTAVLRDAGICCVPCGGVFIVADRWQARAVLLQAGFQRSRISAGALLEPFSASTLYLLERPTSPPGSGPLASERPDET